MDLEALVAPVVDAAGLDLVDVEMRHEGKRRVVRVTVDRDGGLDLDTIARVSERVSRRLDVEGFDPGPYSLEVTSPGVERPLRRPSDFADRLGQRVRVRLETDRRRETLTGTLLAADDEAVTIDTESGERALRYESIVSSRLVVDFDEELKRAKKKRSTE